MGCSIGDAEKIRALINELMERDDYPSRADYNKRKHYEELSNRFFSVQHFLETYGDPFVYFYYAKRPTQPVRFIFSLWLHVSYPLLFADASETHVEWCVYSASELNI